MVASQLSVVGQPRSIERVNRFQRLVEVTEQALRHMQAARSLPNSAWTTTYDHRIERYRQLYRAVRLEAYALAEAIDGEEAS